MLVVEREFTQQVGGTLLPFAAGSVIKNQPLEAELIRTGAPVRKVAHDSDLITCPHCAKMFTVAQAIAMEEDPV